MLPQLKDRVIHVNSVAQNKHSMNHSLKAIFYFVLATSQHKR
jgi:hypothetical protein